MPSNPVEFGYKIPLSIGLVILMVSVSFFIGYELASVYTLERRLDVKTGRNSEKTETNETRIRSLEDRVLILEAQLKE